MQHTPSDCSQQTDWKEQTNAVSGKISAATVLLQLDCILRIRPPAECSRRPQKQRTPVVAHIHTTLFNQLGLWLGLGEVRVRVKFRDRSSCAQLVRVAVSLQVRCRVRFARPMSTLRVGSGPELGSGLAFGPALGLGLVLGLGLEEVLGLGLGSCKCLTRTRLLCQKEMGLKKQRERSWASEERRKMGP